MGEVAAATGDGDIDWTLALLKRNHEDNSDKSSDRALLGVFNGLLSERTPFRCILSSPNKYGYMSYEVYASVSDYN